MVDPALLNNCRALAISENWYMHFFYTTGKCFQEMKAYSRSSVLAIFFSSDNNNQEDGLSKDYV